MPSSAASGQININAMELSCLLFHDFGRLRTGLIMIMALICLVVQYLLCRPHNGWPVVGGGDHRAAEEVIKNLSPEAIKLRSVCDELRLVISGKKRVDRADAFRGWMEQETHFKFIYKSFSRELYILI